jgi:hypothetical protein
VSALLLWADSIIYDILVLIQSVLVVSSSVPNAQVQIPTFSNAVANLEVALCQFGAVVGSLLPVTFSCSAQLQYYQGQVPNIPGPSGSTIPNAPEVITAEPVPIIPNSQRTYASFCGYNRTEWAFISPLGCDCPNLILAWNNPFPLVGPFCFLECLPGISFPLTIGADELPGYWNGTQPVNVIFSNATTLHRFLQQTIDQGTQPILGFTPGSKVDPLAPPGTNISQILPEAEFIAELTVAYLNERYGRLYNPAFEIVWRQGDFNASTGNWTNGVFDNVNGTCNHWPFLTGFAEFETLLALGQQNGNAATGVSMRQYVDMSMRMIYATAFSVTGFQNLFQQNSYATNPNHINVFATNVAAALPYPAIVTWNVTATFMYNGLRIFNRAYERCLTTAPEYVCFNRNRVVQPSDTPQPWDSPAPVNVSAVSGAANATIITWTPLELSTFVVAGVDCDCSVPSAYYYDGVKRLLPRAGACLLLCDGPSFPYLLGERPDQNYLAGFSEMYTGVEMDSLQAMRDILGNGQPSTFGPPDLDYFSWQAALNVSASQALAGMLLAARINLIYLTRYLPNRYLFVRPYGDPLLMGCGLTNISDQQLYGSVRLDILINVLITIHYGDQNAVRDCNGHYTFDNNPLELTFCQQFTTRYGFNQFDPSSGSTFNAAMVNNLYVLLYNLFSFSPGGNGTAGTNACFVQAVVINANNSFGVLPPISNVSSDTPGLPPLDFVSILHALFLLLFFSSSFSIN